MSDKQVLAQQLEFKLITTTKNKQLKLTHKQIVVMLEALWDFKESIQTIDTEEFLRKRILQNKEDDPGMETMSWLEKK